MMKIVCIGENIFRRSKISGLGGYGLGPRSVEKLVEIGNTSSYEVLPQRVSEYTS